MTTFKDLGVSAPILKALAAEGYETPTPIQTQALPIVLGGRDLIGLAQTGTGKTAAFALPMLDRLSAERKHAGQRACRALVLAPTRELAAQIGASFRTYGRFLGLSAAVVFGGASMFKQKEALARGVDILVATPGRLLDHVTRRSLTLDRVEILVLDETDRMLDMGFIQDLRRIEKMLPAKRQTLFFSATMPKPIADLAHEFLTDPEKIAVAPVSSAAERVQQTIVHVDHADKQSLLHRLLEDPAVTRAVVFTRTKHGADRVARKLDAAGVEAEAIHGNKSQGQRTRALGAFKKGEARLLVATEIVARGIDVDDVSHVINFDMPDMPEQYVHRIGRTARAGKEGVAISFCAPDERALLRDIERLTRQSIPVAQTDFSLEPPSPADRTPRPANASRPRNPSRRPAQNKRPRNADVDGAAGRRDHRDAPRGEHRPERGLDRNIDRNIERAPGRKKEGDHDRRQERGDERGGERRRESSGERSGQRSGEQSIERQRQRDHAPREERAARPSRPKRANASRAGRPSDNRGPQSRPPSRTAKRRKPKSQ